MSYFLQGFGVFLGVIAGVVVNIGVQRYLIWRSQSQTVRNLKFELDFNIRKLDRFLEQMVAYRNAVNADSLSTYFAYFDLSRIISATTYNMLYSGLLYKYLSYEDIAQLQAILSGLSVQNENFMNNQILQNKLNFQKQKAAADVDLWERMFKDYKRTLEEIKAKLK
jgi:hypothetical protein